MAELDKAALEALVRQVLLEKLGAAAGCGRGHGVRSVAVSAIQVTGPAGHRAQRGPGVDKGPLFSGRGAPSGLRSHGDGGDHLSLEAHI